MAEATAWPGWKKHTCGEKCDDADCTEVVYFPPDGEWVAVIERVSAREVGDDAMWEVPAGRAGVVIGVWEDCHDVHVLFNDPSGVIGDQELWIDPTNLKPRHMVQIKPMILTGKEAIDANPAEATDFSVYLGAPGRFEWQQDFPTVEQARWYAGELAKTHDVPESDIEDLTRPLPGEKAPAAPERVHLDRIGLTDQPTTCPQCGRRTELVEEIEPNTEHHKCACGYEFIGVWDYDDEVTFTVRYDGGLVTSEFMAEHLQELEGVESVHIEEETEDDDERPRTTCGCGFPIVYTEEGWQHDAAPYFWGNDHDADPDPIAQARAEAWDAEHEED